MTNDAVSRVWWTLTLTVLTAFVCGTVVSVTDPATELRYVVAFGVLAAPTVFVLLGRRRTRWLDPHPFVRFLTFFFSLFVAVVSLDAIVNLTLGTTGLLARASELLAIVSGVTIALWMTFDVGGERAWALVLEVTGIDW